MRLSQCKQRLRLQVCANQAGYKTSINAIVAKVLLQIALALKVAKLACENTLEIIQTQRSRSRSSTCALGIVGSSHRRGFKARDCIRGWR